MSIDFVLHPASVKEKRRPIAIFLDGLSHHADRIGKDLLQRMALQASGDYDAWSLTWEDIDWALGKDPGLPPLQLHPSGADLKDYWRQLGHAAHARAIDKQPLELLMESLAQAEDPVDWARMGAIALAAQLDMGADRNAWAREISSRVPDAVREAIGEPTGEELLIRRVAEGTGQVSVWGYAAKEVIADPSRHDDWRVVVHFDDREEVRAERSFREGWRGLLHMALFLRELRGVFFVTSHGQERLDLDALLRARGAWAEQLPAGWADIDLDECEFLGPALAAAGVPRPEVGVDVPDAKGLSCGVVAELLWEERKVAVVDQPDASYLQNVAPGWQLFEMEALRDDAGPLLEALESA